MDSSIIPFPAERQQPAVVITSKTHALAHSINEEHRLAHQCVREKVAAEVGAVQHAIRCGELLIEQQKLLKHGEFQKWIKTNCEFAYSTAARYMKAATQKSTGVEFCNLSGLFPSGRKDAPRNSPPIVAEAIAQPEAEDHDDQDNDDADDLHQRAQREHQEKPRPPAAVDAPKEQQQVTIDAALKELTRCTDSGDSKLVANVRILRSKATKLRNELQRIEKDLRDAEARAIEVVRRRMGSK